MAMSSGNCVVDFWQAATCLEVILLFQLPSLCYFNHGKKRWDFCGDGGCRGMPGTRGGGLCGGRKDADENEVEGAGDHGG